uniref:Freezing-induced protein 2 n=1 Tax=Leymus chinensis TaxID=52714 RepID=A0A2S1ZR78_LEYCH|nr:freezing-induced protein 2 [Leymus chinensis]
MPCLGSMPLGFQPPELASSSRWTLPSSSTSSPWWRKREGAGSAGIPPNKLAAVPRVEADLVLFPLSLRSRGDGGEQGVRIHHGFVPWRCASPDPSFRRRLYRPLIWRRTSGVDLEMDDGDHELNRRWFQRSHGAHGGWPVSSHDPSHLRAEWRPSSFLLACVPNGRQFCTKMESAASYCGGLAGPSGPSPAPAKIASMAKQFGPDCVFHFMFGVLFVRSRVWSVIFSFFRVLCVMLCTTTLIK